MFIRVDQYNFIKAQTQYLLNGYGTTNDIRVLDALKSLTQEKIINLFPQINEEQSELLKPIINVRDQASAEIFLQQVKPYVIPFRTVEQQAIKKLFPKVKKLKVPSLEKVELQETSYLAWDDTGTNKRYIILHYDNKIKGFQGTFKISYKQGVCSLCNRHGQVGLFSIEKKGSTQDSYINRGNYICEDSRKCNQQITSQEKLFEFFESLGR
ncbi:FusB/FusC family EF-G-binding protein [Bacillus rubiinfantis]|uniref:FusB/FusC family EF-G-binding protein n=1 Tax=Bacillus rubiinfantis TaxID=1499680 RepID=UPI001FEA14F5|nr:FusB/FusC family EF-G-binding protein [Bacillus rubiinfantis]